MLKEFLWKSFEKTGNIDNYLFFKELCNKERNSNGKWVVKSIRRDGYC